MERMFRGFWGRIVTCFLAGVFTIMPLFITILVVVWVAGFIEGFLGPNTFLGRRLQWLGLQVMGEATTTIAYVFGWLLVIAAIFLLGVLAQAGTKKFLHAVVDPVIRCIPLAGSVYNTAKQIVGMLEKTDESNLKGMSVVYCSFGKQHAGGILALMPTPDRYHFHDRDYYAVYIPTSPVPMTGGLMFVPVESVQTVDMTVDGLMSVYLSMGVTGPQFLPAARATEP